MITKTSEFYNQLILKECRVAEFELASAWRWIVGFLFLLSVFGVFSLEVRAELCHHVPDLQMAYEQADVVVLARKFHGKKIEVFRSWKLQFPDPYRYSVDDLRSGSIQLPERYSYPLENGEEKFLFLVHDEKHPATFRAIACSGDMDFKNKAHLEIFRWIERRALPDRAREWVDRVIQSLGQDEAPETRKKIAGVLLKIGRETVPTNNSDHFAELNRAFYDEVDRRFRADKLPAVQAMVAEMVLLKGIWLRHANWRNPTESIPIFEEFETRFGKDDNPAIRELYVISLVEKGNALVRDHPEKAVAIYDEVVSRYAEDISPAIRAQAAHALLLKTRSFKDPTAILNEIEHRFGKDAAPEIQEMVLEMLFIKARLRSGNKEEDQRAVLVICDEINRRFGKDNVEIRVKIIRLLTSAGLYEQVVQRFGEDSTVQGSVARTLLYLGERLEGKGNFDAALSVYDEANRRVKGKRIDVLDKKGRLLQRQGNLDAAFALYEEIGQHFEDNDDVALSLFRRGEILKEQGKFEEAIAMCDEIEQRFGKDQVVQMRGFISGAIRLRAAIRER
jgi:tetratricopeptide (TPR) repeat protein